MMASESKDILERLGVIITGSHIVYTKGGHGSDYVNKDALLPHPVETSAVCRDMAHWIADTVPDVEVVIGPVVGGAVIAQLVAVHLCQMLDREVLALFADKEPDPADPKQDVLVIRRGYDKLIWNKKTVALEDTLNSGGSLKNLVLAARAKGADVLAAVAIVNRGGVTAEGAGGVPILHTLMSVTLDCWPATDCPLCAQGVPINVDVGHGRKFLADKQGL